MSIEESARIVRVMSEPSFYDHPVDEVTMVETHISWVFLAGEFAYKVKKPLDLGFLDYSTLEKRKHFCRKELEFNRCFAAGLYLDVICIGGNPERPTINTRPVLEYAVKMRRFPCACQLDRMLAEDQLRPHHILAFAELLATLHAGAQPVAADSVFGTPEAAIAPIHENFRQIRPLVEDAERTSQLDRLEVWAGDAIARLSSVIAERKSAGFVRSCHGDVHLANMAWFEGRPLLFDCIEFNDNLRLIDVVNEIAFLVMDLDDRQRSELGWSFLNRYLQLTGDYTGLPLLNFYKFYRALVRAKVTGLRLSQGHFDSEEERQSVAELFFSYLDLAEEYTQSRQAPLIITHGFSGAGKSTFASSFANRFGAIQLRSDIERKRLHGLAGTQASGSPVDGGIYSAAAFAATYNRLLEYARLIIAGGIPVIVDATFLKEQQRGLFRKLSEQLQVPLVILDFPRTDEELLYGIEQRAQKTIEDASEAGLEVLRFQQQHAEALAADELRHVITVKVDTACEAVIAVLNKTAMDH